MNTDRPSPLDFTDERNRYCVELFDKGWYAHTAHPTIFGARVEAGYCIRAGRLTRIIDLRYGGRVVA